MIIFNKALYSEGLKLLYFSGVTQARVPSALKHYQESSEKTYDTEITHLGCQLGGEVFEQVS